MKVMTQRAAVFAAICSVTGQSSFDSAVVLTDEQRSAVMSILCEGFKQGGIQLADTEKNKEKLSDNSELRKYVSGLISNWLRKDEMLNGHTKYVAKNPGSRAGQGDEQLKNLKNLRNAFFAKGETVKVGLIDQAIAKRTAEITAEKAATKVKEIDYSVLDPKLVEALGFNSEEEQ